MLVGVVEGDVVAVDTAVVVCVEVADDVAVEMQVPQSTGHLGRKLAPDKAGLHTASSLPQSVSSGRPLHTWVVVVVVVTVTVVTVVVVDVVEESVVVVLEALVVVDVMLVVVLDTVVVVELAVVDEYVTVVVVFVVLVPVMVVVVTVVMVVTVVVVTVDVVVTDVVVVVLDTLVVVAVTDVVVVAVVEVLVVVVVVVCDVVVVLLHTYPFVLPEHVPSLYSVPAHSMLSHCVHFDATLIHFSAAFSRHIFQPLLVTPPSVFHDMLSLVSTCTLKPDPL